MQQPLAHSGCSHAVAALPELPLSVATIAVSTLASLKQAINSLKRKKDLVHSEFCVDPTYQIIVVGDPLEYHYQ